MQLIPREIINSDLRDSIRKARYAHLLFKANTLEHDGTNNCDDI